MKSTQQALALMGVARRPVLTEQWLIDRLPDAHEALLCQYRQSGMTEQAVGDALGLDKGHQSRVLNGGAHFPTRKLRALQDVTGSVAMAQWLADRAGYRLVKKEAHEMPHWSQQA